MSRRKPKPLPVNFRELLDAASVGVRRELTWQEVGAAYDGYSEFAAAVELNDGRILLCRTEQGFGGSEVTPPDPVEVAFYILDAPAPASHFPESRP